MLAKTFAIATLLWVAVAPAACLAARAELPATPPCHAAAPAPSDSDSAPDAQACCDPCDGYVCSSAPDAQDADHAGLLVRSVAPQLPTADLPAAAPWRPPDRNRSPYARVNPPLLR